jgi:hypothetical protein
MRFRTAPRWSPPNATHIVYSLIHMGSLVGLAKIWGGFHRRIKAIFESRSSAVSMGTYVTHSRSRSPQDVPVVTAGKCGELK